MARPKTDGLHYFPMDVDFFSDIKIRTLRANYGADGIGVYMYILCEIYRKSYFVRADEDFTALAAADMGITIDRAAEIIAYLCRRSLFDGELFTSEKVLTCRGVQLRFQEAHRGSKRKYVVEKKLWLLSDEETLEHITIYPEMSFSENNDSFSEKNEDNSEKNDTKQSKAKERKEKESKAEQSKASPNPTSSDTVEAAEPPCAAANENLREELLAKYGSEAVRKYEQKFSEWEKREGKVSVELYPTIARWLEQDIPPNKGKHVNNPSFDTADVWESIMRKYQTSDSG